jgi:hypothetical protein
MGLQTDSAGPIAGPRRSPSVRFRDPDGVHRTPEIGDSPNRRWTKVQKCGDQRASPRFVFNELSHFLFADSWRSCCIARPVVP